MGVRFSTEVCRLRERSGTGAGECRQERRPIGFHHGHDHAHGHDHEHALGHGPSAQAQASDRTDVSRRLGWVLVVTSAFMVAELVGGLVSGSLALLADAGHMFSDVGALALSLFAIRLARRPPTARRTYGYARVEILAALVNGATLLLVAGLILMEAWDRSRAPVEIDGAVMLVVASIGLAVNLLGAFVLHGHAHANLNVRGAYLHILGDLLGSVGAIAAGVIVLTTGWTLADPIISALIAVLILVSAWKLVREAADVLMESAPSHIDPNDVVEALRTIGGLDDIHDVHVWTLTSGFIALSGHGVIDDPKQHMRILEDVRARVGAFGIEHVTFQIELRELVQLEKQDR